MKNDELEQVIQQIDTIEKFEQLRKLQEAIFDRIADLAYEQGQGKREEREREIKALRFFVKSLTKWDE